MQTTSFLKLGVDIRQLNINQTKKEIPNQYSQTVKKGLVKYQTLHSPASYLKSYVMHRF